MQLGGQFLFSTRFIVQVQLGNNQSSKGNQYYLWKFTGVLSATPEIAGKSKSEEAHGARVQIGIPSTAATSEVQVVDPTSSATTNTVVDVRRLGLDGAGDLAITTTTTTVTTSLSIIQGLSGLRVE